MVRLPQFIRQHAEEIVAAWETFARTLPVTQSMDIAALRDHAREMLGVIARDLETPQTSIEQSDKSEGKSDASETGPPTTAAQHHGAARAGSGFTMAQMLSELRALRASVIQLWTAQQGQLVADDLADLTRFNEAIDQAIAESVTQFGENVGQSRDRFLAILGHDLRNPLGAIIMSASFILEDDVAERHRLLVTRIDRSARRMNQMVSDLLDFTRTSFGGAIPIAREDVDVTGVIEDVVAEVSTRYPAAVVRAHTNGALRGHWDGNRLAQALTNLVMNAVQHGKTDSPITVSAQGSAREVTISVRNEGPAIRDQHIARLFTPEGSGAHRSHDDGHLGLGLFIVDRIVAAHGGTVEVQSAEAQGTTFTIHLPRAA